MFAKCFAAAILAAAVTGCAIAPAEITTPVKYADPSDAAVTQKVGALLDQGLTPASAEEIALLNNRRILAVYEQLNIARSDVLQATLIKNPVLDAALKIPLSGGATGAELSIVGDFLDLLWVPLRTRMATESFYAAKAQVEGAARELASEVIAAYHTARSAEEIAALRKQSLTAAEVAAEFAKRMHAAGTVTELELATLTASAEQAKLELASAEAEAAAARERLSGLLALDAAQTWKFADQADEVAVEPEMAERLEARAIEKSLAIETLRRKFEASAAKHQLANPLGFLGAGAVAEKDYDNGWAPGPSLSIEIPIFDQGQAKVAGAAAEVRKSKQELLSTQRQITSQVRESRIRLVAARSRVLQYKNVLLPLREKITAQTQLENNGMLVSVFHLLAIKQEEIDARIAYRIALRDYRIADASLNQLVLGGHLQNSSTGEK